MIMNMRFFDNNNIKMKITTVALILGLSAAVHGQADIPFRKCKALVLSGGANRGAYEAGVIHGLSRLLNGTDAYYDVVSGVSAGALNSGAMAMWAPSQALEMSEWLVQFWQNTTN